MYYTILCYAMLYCTLMYYVHPGYLKALKAIFFFSYLPYLIILKIPHVNTAHILFRIG